MNTFGRTMQADQHGLL